MRYTYPCVLDRKRTHSITHTHTHTCLPLVLVAMSATFWKASRNATAAKTVVLKSNGINWWWCLFSAFNKTLLTWQVRMWAGDWTYRSWECSLVALALKSSQTGYEHCKRTKTQGELWMCTLCKYEFNVQSTKCYVFRFSALFVHYTVQNVEAVRFFYVM